MTYLCCVMAMWRATAMVMKPPLRSQFALAALIGAPTLSIVLDIWREHAPQSEGLLNIIQNHNSNFLWSVLLVSVLAEKLSANLPARTQPFSGPSPSQGRNIALATAALVAVNIG